MPQQKTGKQTFLMILSILKFIGAAFFIAIGGFIIAAGGMAEVQEAIEPMISQLDDPSISGSMILGVAGGLFILIGALGIVHGILDLKASKPMGGTTGAIVMGILALIWNGLMVFGNIGGDDPSNLLWPIIMLVLNVARVVLAFMIKGDNNNMAAMGGGMGMPMGGGMPPQGGYGQPQPQQFPQQGGYDPNYGQNGNYGQGGNYGNGGF